ncbi:MAG: TIGR03032 family protein, partial [Flavobacteriales bacterium]|nr:TIGR03032 family protein [Flavobacteriales bacterium]
FMPRATYYSGALDIHDLSWGQGELYAVNTLFSNIVKINEAHSFVPYWQPPFISNLVSEDRCHLNGMAMKDGAPKYATAFNQGDSFQSWRDEVTKEGVILDVESSEVIADKLPMPHTPRIFNDELYVLLSATGELARVNINDGRYEVVIKIDGFVRGMAQYGDFLFIGLSRLRKNSSTFAQLEISKKALNAGIAIVHLPTASLYGKIDYHSSVDEIYDVQVLPNKIRPNILSTLKPEFKRGLSTPDATYWAKDENSSPSN